MAIMDEKDTPFDSADDLIRFYAKPLNGWTPAMLTNGWYNHMRPILDMLEVSIRDTGYIAILAVARASVSPAHGGVTSPTA